MTAGRSPALVIKILRTAVITLVKALANGAVPKAPVVPGLAAAALPTVPAIPHVKQTRNFMWSPVKAVSAALPPVVG